jgi:hypothetical protein
MKKVLLLLIFVSLITSNVFAKDILFDYRKTRENPENYDFTTEIDKENIFSLQSSLLILLFNIYSLGDDLGIFALDFEGQYKINDIYNLSLTTSFLINFNRYSGNNYQVVFKPMFIYRPYKTGLSGFYFGLYSNIGWISETGFDGWNTSIGWGGDRRTSLQIGVGFNTGYKWIFNNGFTLQLGTGIGKTFDIPGRYHYTELNSDGRFTFPGFDMHILDFKLGYSF